MSEPKICPFRRDILVGDMAPHHISHFAPCLEERCAMWRKYHQIQGTTPYGGALRDEWIGYCGLAGKP